MFVEVLGFWKRSSLERLTRLLPRYGPPRFVLAISDRLKVDEEALQELAVPILRFKEIPNATELAGPPGSLRRPGRARSTAAALIFIDVFSLIERTMSRGQPAPGCLVHGRCFAPCWPSPRSPGRPTRS